MNPLRRGRGRLLALYVTLILLVVAAAGWLVWEVVGLPPARPEGDGVSPTAHEMVVADIVRERGGGGVVLVLQEKGRQRFLLLTIGEAEALSILVQMEGTRAPRPLTHDLMVRTLGELGAQVKRVVVTDLRGGTYYAHLVLRVDGREVEVDSRPSDAVALALRAQAPIYAEEALLERAALSTEQPF